MKTSRYPVEICPQGQVYKTANFGVTRKSSPATDSGFRKQNTCRFEVRVAQIRRLTTSVPFFNVKK